MGGVVCWIRRSAMLTFETVPTNPSDQGVFDAQIRKLASAPGIAESIVSDAADKAHKFCLTLGKTSFSQDDRVFLLGVIESLYES